MEGALEAARREGSGVTFFFFHFHLPFPIDALLSSSTALKQGNPTAYGRIGEEVLHFREHGYDSFVVRAL